MEIPEHPPAMTKTSMAGSLGGADRDPGASTIYVGDVDGAPWEALTEIQEHPPPMSEISMASPLGAANGDPGAPTTDVGDIDGGPPRRHCRRLRSAQHLCWRHRWWTPREVLSKNQEWPPPMLETSMASPPRTRCRRPRSAHQLT
jgi:hypothetical protein